MLGGDGERRLAEGRVCVPGWLGGSVDPGIGGIQTVAVEPPTFDRAIIVEPWNRAIIVNRPPSTTLSRGT
jgi:hypothetical protein